MTTTTIQFNAQDVYSVIDSLKPSLKAKITKGDNKLRNEMAMRNKPYMDDYRQVIDEHAPRRDSIIAKARAERDAIIAEAEAKFQAVRRDAQAEFEIEVKPLYEVQNKVWQENYVIYLNQWKALVEEVSGQEIA